MATFLIPHAPFDEVESNAVFDTFNQIPDLRERLRAMRMLYSSYGWVPRPYEVYLQEYMRRLNLIENDEEEIPEGDEIATMNFSNMTLSDLEQLSERLKKQIEDVKKEYDEKPTCPICKNGEIDIAPAILKCGHILCTQCAFNLSPRRCPLCRQSVCNLNDILVCKEGQTIGECKDRLKNN